MREKCDMYGEQYHLNFSLIATPAEGLSGRFINIDKAIYYNQKYINLLVDEIGLFDAGVRRLISAIDGAQVLPIVGRVRRKHLKHVICMFSIFLLLG